jgi:glucokinase
MHHKFPLLYDLHISEALNPLLITGHTLPMRFLNDATCFAVGEAWQGTGKHYPKVVVITLGTGFGSAFLDQGIPVVSGGQVPKEGCLWHLPFRDGIADDYFSTRWFINEYRKHTGESISGVKELMQKVESDLFVSSLFTQFGQNLAECLAPWLRNFGAEILIIGGNIARALPLFMPDFRKALWESDVYLPVVPSLLMENAALIGSARLLDNTFWNQVSLHLPRL